MKTITTLLVVLMLISSVDATCRSYCDYFMNVTTISQGNLSIASIYEAATENGEGQVYVWSNLSNVLITPTNGTKLFDFYVYDDGGIIFVNVTDACAGGCPSYEGAIEICLNGTENEYTYNEITTGTPGGTETAYTLTSFTRYYRRNWTFREEETNDLFDFTNIAADLDVACENYAGFTENITDKVGSGGSITVQSLEEPKNILISPGIVRVRQDTDYSLKDDFYLAATTADAMEHTFTLVDHTGGQFKNAYIYIRKPIGGSLKNIHVEKFWDDNLIFPYLLNQTQYNIRLVGTSTRNFDPLTINDNDLDKDIPVTIPDFGQIPARWDGLNISLTTSWDNKQVACAYTSDVAITLAEFYVYNTTSTPYTQLYNANDTAASASISYVVPHENDTYLLKCVVTDSTHGIREITELHSLRNETAIYRGFDLNLPATTFGITRAWVYKLASLFIIFIVFALFSALSFGTGSIAGVTSVIFFVWIGWLTAPWWFMGFLAFFALFMKLTENRVGVGG